MRKMKWFVLLCVLCLTVALTGCTAATNDTNDKITIVCTNFPLYDWTRNLLGESKAEVILLLDNGTDMHSFQPSVEEMIQIAQCDILVHVGGESDAWLIDALEANPNEERVVVNLMEVLKDDVRTEHYVEGMQTEHVHEDGSVHEGVHDHDSDTVIAENGATQAHDTVAMDEHVWLSLRLAAKACDAIEEALCQVLPEDEQMIQANGNAYYDKLVALDQEYVDMIMCSDPENVVIVADRFPFMYLMEDYAIEYYAAFPGCSTESEADFETVVFLAEKVSETDTDVLLITESGTDTLAKTVFENAGMNGETVVLHSMQVVYRSDIEAGGSYIGYMEENLATLEKVLGE